MMDCHDLNLIKRNVDLLALAGGEERLKRVANTGGGEWAGPCPFCGGRDRFRLQPQHPSGQRWFCRHCSGNSGGWRDVLDFLQMRDNCDFAAALAEAERLAGVPIDHQPQQTAPIAAPAAPEPPNPAWQAKAQRIATWAEGRLWSDQGARVRAWLAQERGITEDTARRWRLGFWPGDGQRGSRFEDLWVPRGLVIPWMDAGNLWCIQVRVAEQGKKQRYQAVTGSRKGGVFGIDCVRGADVAVVTEGELDTCLLWQEASELADVFTLGSVADHAAARGKALSVLFRPPRLLVALDADEPGCRAALLLLELLGRRGWRILPPGGKKDVTESWQAGWNLRDWLTREIEKIGCV